MASGKSPTNLVDLTGMKFNRLSVVERPCALVVLMRMREVRCCSRCETAFRSHKVLRLHCRQKQRNAWIVENADV